MSVVLHEKWDSYIEWLLTPLEHRGVVDTETAWARENGLTTRTLRRWKSLPEFQERYADIEARGVETVKDDVETVGGDEGDYQVVKATLIQGAKSGNPKYLDLYFRTYGKPFVEEEVASRSLDMAGMELEDLVAQAVVSVGADIVADKLRALGWVCEAP